MADKSYTTITNYTQKKFLLVFFLLSKKHNELTVSVSVQTIAQFLFNQLLYNRRLHTLYRLISLTFYQDTFTSEQCSILKGYGFKKHHLAIPSENQTTFNIQFTATGTCSTSHTHAHMQLNYFTL